MSNNCNVVITDLIDGTEIILYRNYDGMLKHAGIEQLQFMKNIYSQNSPIHSSPTVDEVMNYYFSKSSEYINVNSISGDSEFLYKIRLNGSKPYEISAFRIDYDNDIRVDTDVTQELADLYRGMYGEECKYLTTYNEKCDLIHNINYKEGTNTCMEYNSFNDFTPLSRNLVFSRATRKNLILSIIFTIKEDIDVNTCFAFNINYEEIKYLHNGFGYKFTIENISNDSDVIDSFIQSKNYIREVLNYISNDVISFSCYDTENTVEFEITSAY